MFIVYCVVSGAHRVRKCSWLYCTVPLCPYVSTGNVPFSATENDLIKFLKLPAQTEVEIPVFRHNPKRKIGFAFATVEVSLVKEVLKFNEEEMMGRKLKVALGKPKDQSKPEKWQRKPIKPGVSVSVRSSIANDCVAV